MKINKIWQQQKKKIDLQRLELVNLTLVISHKIELEKRKDKKDYSTKRKKGKTGAKMSGSQISFFPQRKFLRGAKFFVRSKKVEN